MAGVFVGVRYYHLDEKLHLTSNSSGEHVEEGNDKKEEITGENGEKKRDKTEYMFPPHHALQARF